MIRKIFISMFSVILSFTFLFTNFSFAKGNSSTANSKAKEFIYEVDTSKFHAYSYRSKKTGDWYYLTIGTPFVEGAHEFVKGMIPFVGEWIDSATKFGHEKLRGYERDKLFDESIQMKFVKQVSDFTTEKVFEEALNLTKYGKASPIVSYIFLGFRTISRGQSNQTDILIDKLNRLNPNIFVSSKKEYLQKKYLIARRYIENSISKEKLNFLKNVNPYSKSLNNKDFVLLYSICNDLVLQYGKFKVPN